MNAEDRQPHGVGLRGLRWPTVAAFCEQVFAHQNLDGLHLRHFDPTTSAATGHEDKGLIECLMVKCAKVLVYCAGGYRSSIAASLLQQRGFEDVSEIAGGIAAWEAARLPVTS